MNIKTILNRPEYSFIDENPQLHNNLFFLCFGGSYAYGTNTKDSDVDIRGIVFNNLRDMLGYSKSPFEQYIDNDTDTVIYALNKMVRLLISCNPNAIEILGCEPEHYVFLSDAGKKLLDNKNLFLSKRAITSFGGYAGQQLNRLLNAIARDSVSQSEREEHILRSVKSAMGSFNERYCDFKSGHIDLSIDKSAKENLDTEIFANISLQHYPLRDFNGILNELGSISRTYSKCNHRNHKKDDNHLNKHAMHLLRLYYMCFDILEKGEINTYRKNERKILLDVRNGLYQKPDHTYRSEFFEMVDKLEERLQYAAKNTFLPEEPDFNKINELVSEINLTFIKSRL